MAKTSAFQKLYAAKFLEKIILYEMYIYDADQPHMCICSHLVISNTLSQPNKEEAGISLRGNCASTDHAVFAHVFRGVQSVVFIAKTKLGKV